MFYNGYYDSTYIKILLRIIWYKMNNLIGANDTRIIFLMRYINYSKLRDIMLKKICG